MITGAIVEQTQSNQPSSSKQPVARLLDLTHGWASFVAHQEPEFGDILPSDDLYALYQDAAQITALHDMDEQSAAVKAFVETRIVPLLLGTNR